MAICQAWFRHALSARQRRARRRKARRQRICDLAQDCNARVSPPCSRQLSPRPRRPPQIAGVQHSREAEDTTAPGYDLYNEAPGASSRTVGNRRSAGAQSRRATNPSAQAIPMDVFMNCEVPTVSSNAQSRNQKACALFRRRPLCHWGGLPFLRAGPHTEDGRGRAGGTPSFPCCEASLGAPLLWFRSWTFWTPTTRTRCAVHSE